MIEARLSSKWDWSCGDGIKLCAVVRLRRFGAIEHRDSEGDHFNGVTVSVRRSSSARNDVQVDRRSSVIVGVHHKRGVCGRVGGKDKRG